LAGLLPGQYRSRAIALASNSGRYVDLAVELKQFLSAAELGRLGFEAGQLGLNDSFLCDETWALFDDVGNDPFLAVSRVETYLYMGSTLLRDADANSMAHSVELRVPYVARPVLETAGRIPGRLQAGRTRQGKYLLRQALADVLPEDVMRRPKTGFTLPLGDWMFGVLRDSCEAAVAALEGLPFLHQDAVQELWASFVAGQKSNYWMKPMLLVALGNYVANCRSGQR